MSEKELKSQRLKAQAMLELMMLEKRNGKYTDADLETQRQIIASLRTFTNTLPALVSVTATPVFSTAPEKKTQTDESTLSPEVQLILNNLRKELRSIDAEKNMLANRMVEIPDETNCKAVVQSIKTLRVGWKNKSDEIWYVLQHGALPAQESPEKEVLLPSDKYELNKMLHNSRSNLSKYRHKLRDAKGEVKKNHYEKNIRIAESIINQIETKLAVV